MPCTGIGPGWMGWIGRPRAATAWPTWCPGGGAACWSSWTPACCPRRGGDIPDVPAGLQVVVASAHPGDPEGQRALVAGAVGYVHAYMPVTGLDRVLRHVMGGEIWVGKGMLSRMLSQIGQAAPEPNQDWARDLTVRERDVARYVALGHSNQSIADSLGITERTVRAHISAIFEKLGVTDRLMLALRVHGIDQTATQGVARGADA